MSKAEAEGDQRCSLQLHRAHAVVTAVSTEIPAAPCAEIQGAVYMAMEVAAEVAAEVARRQKGVLHEGNVEWEGDAIGVP